MLVINSLNFIINNYLVINFMKSKYKIYLKYYGLINLAININNNNYLLMIIVIGISTDNNMLNFNNFSYYRIINYVPSIQIVYVLIKL